MTDMVERAARAICEDEGYRPDRHYPSMRYTPAWKNYVSNARTSLGAAFQVTDEDADIFFGRGEKGGAEFINHGWLRDFKTAMQALADAALKEEL